MEQIKHRDKLKSGIFCFVTFVSLNSSSMLFPSVPLHVLSLFSLWLSTLFFLALTLPLLTDIGSGDLREATPAM